MHPNNYSDKEWIHMLEICGCERCRRSLSLILPATEQLQAAETSAFEFEEQYIAEQNKYNDLLKRYERLACAHNEIHERFDKLTQEFHTLKHPPTEKAPETLAPTCTLPTGN